MQHFWRTIRAALIVSIAAVPYAVADPRVAGFIEHTPWLTSTYPVVAGVAYAVYRAYRERGTVADEAASSSGAPTMGAK